jgi:amylosucrase
MDDLEALASQLRAAGYQPVHRPRLQPHGKGAPWAQGPSWAMRHYQDYYLMYPDRTLPDQYELTLPEVFPDFAPGNFTTTRDRQVGVDDL